MRPVVWIVLVLVAAAAFHARLAAWPAAPDPVLALAAWAVVIGDPRAWAWRVWLAGAVRDMVDPGTVWFHAGAHLVAVAALLPLRRWLPTVAWLALLLCGAGLDVLMQALDLVVSGLGGWRWWQGVLDAALTGLLAVLLGQLVPGPRRTVTMPAEDDPGRPVTDAG